MQDIKFFYFSSDYDVGDDMKNPLAAAGAVKDALSTGGVDKVRPSFACKLNFLHKSKPTQFRIFK